MTARTSLLATGIGLKALARLNRRFSLGTRPPFYPMPRDF